RRASRGRPSMTTDRPRVRRARTPSFYERALSASDREVFQDALEVDGVDDEIALLRVHIHRLIEEQTSGAGEGGTNGGAKDGEALRAGIRLLVQALSARHRLTGREAQTLTETATDLFEQFIAAFSDGGPGATEVRDA